MGDSTSEMDTDMDDVTTGRDGQDASTPTAKDTGMDDKGSGENKGQTELEKLQAQLQAANDEAATRRHKIAELEKKIKDSERAKMSEDEQLQAELEELRQLKAAHETMRPDYEAMQTAVQAQVDALKESLKLPDHVADLLEGMSAAKQLEYLVKHQKALAPEQKRKPEFHTDGKTNSTKTPKEKEARNEKLKKRMRLHRR